MDGRRTARPPPGSSQGDLADGWQVQTFSEFNLVVIFETIRRRQLDGYSLDTKHDEVSDVAPDLLHAAWQSLAHE